MDDEPLNNPPSDLVHDEHEVDGGPPNIFIDGAVSAAYEEATDEWDNVQEITPGFRDPSAVNAPDYNPEPPPSQIQLITVDQVVNYLNHTNMQPFLSSLRTSPERQGIFRLIYCVCRTQQLPGHLKQAKQLIQATALMPFNNEEPVHLAVLQTLYKQLTGARFDCPRYGSHWEDIGFQGNDPSTDLRGVGFLGLINALYLVITPEIFPFAKDVHRLSLNETQEFPLMVLSINVTRMALHALRDGLLDKRCREEGDVWTTFNFFYAAIIYHIYHIWKSQRKTITDSGFVLKDAEAYCRKNVKIVEKALERHLGTAYTVTAKQAARDAIFAATQ